MPLADYSHHNEEAARIWWEEEGRHPTQRLEPRQELNLICLYEEQS